MGKQIVNELDVNAADVDKLGPSGGKKPNGGWRKWVKRVFVAVAIVILLALIGTVVYMAIPRSATSEARAVMTSAEQSVFVPEGASESDEFEYGLVFYPGAKVEPAAYAPLMQELADRGWLVATVDAPAHFMLLNIDAASEVIAKYPQVKHWYVGGHSLGGVCASYFASAHSEELAGVILLASWPAVDLSKTSLDVVTIRGENDAVLTAERLEEYKHYMPASTRYLAIEGGNHSQFGYYGTSMEDNPATISAADQQTQAVDFIVSGLPE